VIRSPNLNPVPPRMRWGALRGLLALAMWLPFATAAAAHTTGENYVFVDVRDDRIDGRFEIHANDLKEKLGITVISGGRPDRSLIDASASRVHDYIRQRFAIAPEGGSDYPIEFTTQDALQLPLGTFVQYHFRMASGPVPDTLRIRHSMLYERDRLHRGLLVIGYNAKTRQHHGEEHVAMVFGPAAVDQSLDLTAIPHLLGGRDMLRQGILHIWIGFDHILFLIALMLPTVLVVQRRSCSPVQGFPRALWNLLSIVTVFTIAHSATLLLAALGFLDVPSRLVESIIALSILLVAFNNLTGHVREGSLLIILCLGLFHGLGFASVMGHLPIRVDSLLKGVIGFNIGVELGQLAIVAALFPVLFVLRRHPLYVPVVLRGGSIVLMLVSGAWLVERAFGSA
jgi:hypothetical protein